MYDSIENRSSASGSVITHPSVARGVWAGGLRNAEHATQQVGEAAVLVDLDLGRIAVDPETGEASVGAEAVIDEPAPVDAWRLAEPAEAFGESLGCLEHGVEDRATEELVLAVAENLGMRPSAHELGA
jgi:hypothetical protein